MTDLVVAITGAGPTDPMLLASRRRPARTLSSSNKPPITRSTGREPLACRPEP